MLSLSSVPSAAGPGSALPPSIATIFATHPATAEKRRPASAPGEGAARASAASSIISSNSSSYPSGRSYPPFLRSAANRALFRTGLSSSRRMYQPAPRAFFSCAMRIGNSATGPRTYTPGSGDPSRNG